MRNAHRLRFSKTGRAKYISHLDLMRTFQRAFLRAGLSIRHTEGFQPHAFVSLPLPLSVGFSSQCEVLEFELLDNLPLECVPQRLNAVLPRGIEVEKCYEASMAAKDLCYVNYIVTLEYEAGSPFGAETAIRDLLSRDSLTVTKFSKKAKSGQVEVDLIPLISKCTVEGQRTTVTLDAVIRAQNPGLNPELLITAIRTYCPDVSPDFVSFHRRATLTADFRPWE